MAALPVLFALVGDLADGGFSVSCRRRRPPILPPTHPAVCVSYADAFVTLGGFLSVCLTVTLPECCWEVVAIGPSPPLLLLFIHYSSLVFFVFPISLSVLKFIAPLYSTCLSFAVHLPFPPASLKAPVWALTSVVQSGSVFGDWVKSCPQE